MWLILILAIILLIFAYLKHNYSYWKKRGLDTPKFHYVAGNLLEQLTLKKNAAVLLQENYK